VSVQKNIQSGLHLIEEKTFKFFLIRCVGIGLHSTSVRLSVHKQRPTGQIETYVTYLLSSRCLSIDQ